MQRQDLAGLPKFKSKASGQHGGSIGWAELPGGMVGVFDTQGGDDSPVLPFSSTDWANFTTGVSSGEWVPVHF